MKIISNFKDVYDQCAAHGIDVDTVYRRYTEIQKVKFEDDFSVLGPRISSASFYTDTFYRYTSMLGRQRHGQIMIMFLVVGEHVMPFVGGIDFRDTEGHQQFINGDAVPSLTLEDGSVSITSGDNIYSPLGRTYSLFEEAIKELKLDVVYGYYRKGTWHGQKYKPEAMAQLLRNISYSRHPFSYDKALTPFKDERWASAIGSPIALVLPSVVDYQDPQRKDRPQKKTHGALVIKNPCIRSLCLTALMDPYTIHQEVSMAMNGFLANREDGETMVSDENRMKAKGFDDISFKTRKGSKKPRRRSSSKKN